MTDLAEVFAELGISHYLQDFIEQGFDTWDTILDIKESDFDALNVKLGHRRKLQRKIADSRGVSSDRALESPGTTAGDDRHLEDLKALPARAGNKEGGGSGAGGAKRKYRRHPKTDENAPERPPSAYVIFSNKMREDLRGRNLSFTEIAKLVGEHWQNLSPPEKDPYEHQASSAKERYNAQLVEYKKTDHYREYSQYLAEFKARQSNQQTVSDLEVSKRPKLEAFPSGGSAETTSSNRSMDTPGSGRGDSSSTRPWVSGGSHSPPQSTMPKLNSAIDVSRVHDPLATGSANALPGYRESIYGTGQQALPWRDAPRDEGPTSLQHYSRMASVPEQRQTHHNVGLLDNRNSTGSVQHSHRAVNGHTQISQPPPLLHSESTNRSSSSASTSSSAYFTPRTPMEPPLDRPMTLPSLYQQKTNGSYENQLAPLRPPSLSPQTSMMGPQQSPKGIHPILDHPSTIPSLRGYPPRPTSSVRQHPSYPPATNPADDNLDPVSALIKAGEIVSRNSQSQSRQL